jgi:hypothetical protein
MCYDFISHGYIAGLVNRDAELILHPTNWVTTDDWVKLGYSQQEYRAVGIARAVENRVWLLSANRYGSTDAVLTTAHASRWVGSVTGECLDHLVLFGMSSLLRALSSYVRFFNGHRPHQGIAKRITERRATGGMPQDCADRMSDGDLAVECQQFLGGLRARRPIRHRRPSGE